MNPVFIFQPDIQNLHIINQHINDKRIKFEDEGHKYWIDGDDTDITSSTTFIHQFFKHFNSDRIIQNIISSNKHKEDTEYKYYKLTKEEIQKMWNDNSQEAMKEGTKLHKTIEDFFNAKEFENNSIEFNYFLHFFHDHQHLTIYRTEWLIFIDFLKITGAIDAVFINFDGTLSIADWKRSKNISAKSFDGREYGKYPLEHIPDSNLYHYSLQLNLYRVIIERFYNKQVKEMFLVVLHPNGSRYDKIYIEKMDKEINLMLLTRIEFLKNKGYVFKEDDIKNLQIPDDLKLEKNETLSDDNHLNTVKYLDSNEDKPFVSFLRRNN